LLQIERVRVSVGGNMTAEAGMRMLRVASVAFAALVIPGFAHAADISGPYYKAPAPTAESWAGAYLGIYAGASGATGAASGISGGLAGGTVGFNWQNGNFVFGIEGDGGWSGLNNVTPCPAAPVTCSASQDWLSSVRGRLGWAVIPELLLYATAGGAFGDVRVPGAAGDQAGWSVGGGFEWMFAPNWSFKAEYLHYDLGTFVCGAGVCAPGQAVNIRFAVDSGKVGFNYHFNWGATSRQY
jgi:outer membrane immunogenic protein